MVPYKILHIYLCVWWIKSWLGLRKVRFRYEIKEINKKWKFRGLKGLGQVMQEYQETSNHFGKKGKKKKKEKKEAPPYVN